MIGIVADDITGANDIGIMYGKAFRKTNVYLYPYALTDKSAVPDVVVMDTNSRLDTEKQAYDKVFESTKLLMDLGCTQYFNKTCSVFRGNIGAEFDAMLDALNENFAVIVLGFPKNGRTTIHQEHFVHGIKLEESNFKNDPVHPMRTSDLVEILQAQTKRKVNAIDVETIRSGYPKIKAEIDRNRENCQYLILDVEDQQSLREIALAIKDEKVIAGASGVAEELALVKVGSGEQADKISPEKLNHTGVLCAAGSLTPQTLEQIAYMKACQFPFIEMETIKLFHEDKKDYLEELIVQLKEMIDGGKDVLLHASNNPDVVAETKKMGKQKGYSNEEISRVVSDSIALVVSEVRKQTDVNRFMLAGGETSAAICNSLGIKGLRVHKEIEPGLPSCINLAVPHDVLVLKSGSFGGVDFFEKAVNHLKE